MRHIYLFLIICSLLPQSLFAQDTTWVQTFTFDDITKRRDIFAFPDGSQTYRKILMYYTLKCDPATTQDSYNCGEWDYSTHNLIWDHRGVLDSTRRTHPTFKVGNASPDSVSYSIAPTYNYYQTQQQSIVHTNTVSLTTASVGMGSDESAYPFRSGQTAAKAQFLWRAEELSAAGLAAGNISGMQFDLSSLGSTLYNLRIKLKQTTRDSLTTASYETDLTTVYFLNTTFAATGWQSLQFHTPFAWDGTSNIAVEISCDAAAGSTDNTVHASQTAWQSGVYTAGTDYCINLNPNGGADHVNFGTTPHIAGNEPRTYEAWGYARAFNDGGLFQAGPGGATGADFSLRTSGTVNQWRAQFWGTPDFDVTLNNSLNNWHHYAVTYNGSTMKVYYDGGLAGQKSYELQTPASDVRVGEWLGTYFRGMVDEFRVWDVALSQTQLRDWKDRDLDATHPQYAALRGSYSFNEGMGSVTADGSPMGNPQGLLKNSAWWKRFSGNELFRNFSATNLRPNVVFEQGVYESVLTNVTATDSLINAPLQIIRYDNPGSSGQIADDSPLVPSLATDTLVVWAANRYSYTYDANGTKVDSTWINSDATLYQSISEWYSPTVEYEIGRFITPYGIGLDLGSEGFRWVYDVTDYAPLLVDSVDLQAGNQQELIDVKFALIHGAAPATVQRIQQIWNKSYASYNYASLDNDASLSAKTLDILPSTDKLKVKTRLTGHGHSSNTGNYPHCCEWKDNTHYLKVNGVTADTWHIWQDFECADNPVYPQGGTWPGSREGWCPGDVVKENDFFVTDGVQNGQITLDYDITPVPTSNQGMGSGNYLMAMQLFEYSAPSHDLDAEIYDVIRPNNWEYYSRRNPICFDPIVTVRNNGNTNLSSIAFSYQVQGGTPETYTWNGNLGYGQKIDIALPISGAEFWLGDPQNRFTATITGVNGGTDSYAANNSMSTNYEMPDIYNEHFRITLKTNNNSNENYYTISDINGDVIYSRDGFSDNTTYNDTMLLAPGCYTLEFYDDGLDGLSYWANTAQGNGYLRLRRIPSTSILKSFEPEFGRYLHYSFIISEQVISIQNPNIPKLIAVYPNPSKGIFEVDLPNISSTYRAEVFNLLGQRIAQQNGNAAIDHLSFDLSQQAAGIYTIVVHTPDQVWTGKVVKE
ncbi:MAG: T9SS type A sorting domain-containing protein [Sphingobacteriales bacterium]|nr:T9SS type A sorting domain-containing protein [Sphingobacteriales bacterium]